MMRANRMIHKKKNGLKEMLTAKFKKGSMVWGISLLVLLCLVCTTLSTWGVDKLYLLATGTIRLF